MSRQLKFHHRQRLAHKRRFRFGRDLSKNPKHWSMVINTPTPCSCFICGKPRQYHGKTIQEQKMMLNYGESIKAPDLI